VTEVVDATEKLEYACKRKR